MSNRTLSENREELIYFAGLFDGEGTMGIYRTHSGSAPNCMCLRVSLGLTNKPVMNWIHQRFGGLLYFRRANKKYGGMVKNRWTWCAAAGHAAAVIEAILPWLIVKREEALVALEWNERVQVWKHQPHPGRRGAPAMTPEEAILREALAHRLKDLKRCSFDEPSITDSFGKI